MGVQRIAEREATQIAQARDDAERVPIAAGGERKLRYRQIEMLPIIAPSIADALARARLITVAGGDLRSTSDCVPCAPPHWRLERPRRLEIGAPALQRATLAAQHPLARDGRGRWGDGSEAREHPRARRRPGALKQMP